MADESDEHGRMNVSPEILSDLKDLFSGPGPSILFERMEQVNTVGLDSILHGIDMDTRIQLLSIDDGMLYKAMKVLLVSSKVWGGKFDLISVGSRGAVFYDGSQVWKCSISAPEEARLLEKVEEAYKGSQKNVIRSKGPVVNEIILPIEYVEGRTLESSIGSATLSPGLYQRISADVFNGLTELKKAGIYHRDIRPSNILLDETKDRAVIIDLGDATDNPDAIPICNRRYGGSDLLSLGQVMYKMATGHNLFNEFGKPSIEAADEIEKLRKSFCEDPLLQENYFHKVCKDVNDRWMSEGIRLCLAAGLGIGDKQLSCPQEIRDAAYAEVRQYFEVNR